MRAESRSEQVIVTLDRDEVGLLAAILTEATLGSSRAEFYIRVGGSLPNIQQLIGNLESISAGQSEGFDLPIVAGVEREENPPRPRPKRGVE